MQETSLAKAMYGYCSGATDFHEQRFSVVAANLQSNTKFCEWIMVVFLGGATAFAIQALICSTAVTSETLDSREHSSRCSYWALNPCVVQFE